MFQGLGGGFPPFSAYISLWTLGCDAGQGQNRKGAGNKEETDCCPFKGGKKLEKVEVEKEDMKCWEADVEDSSAGCLFWKWEKQWRNKRIETGGLSSKSPLWTSEDSFSRGLLAAMVNTIRLFLSLSFSAVISFSWTWEGELAVLPLVA